MFDRIQARDVEVVQEPAERPYGVRDRAVRDAAGNMVRIQERSPPKRQETLCEQGVSWYCCLNQTCARRDSNL